MRGRGRILRGEAPLPNPPRPWTPPSNEAIEEALQRILVLAPCYSIESWLYQNTDGSLACCQKHHAHNGHQEMIREWAGDRSLLDQVSRPKDEALTCVADRHNLELAMGFPATDVWLAERSFHEAVERTRQCAALVKALSPPSSWDQGCPTP